MFEFFWVRTASVWIAALYLMMGLALLLFPAAGSTLFIWALAAGAGIYGAGHLIRWFQGRKAGRENPGDLFLTVLPAAFAASSLSRKNERTRAQIFSPVDPGSMTTQPQSDPAATWSISSPKPVTSLRMLAPAARARWATQG